jgi:hypothetical protein
MDEEKVEIEFPGNNEIIQVKMNLKSNEFLDSQRNT